MCAPGDNEDLFQQIKEGKIDIVLSRVGKNQSLFSIRSDFICFHFLKRLHSSWPLEADRVVDGGRPRAGLREELDLAAVAEKGGQEWIQGCASIV
jgi:hypothetical protein